MVPILRDAIKVDAACLGNHGTQLAALESGH
jgi:hypothetical protein